MSRPPTILLANLGIPTGTGPINPTTVINAFMVIIVYRPIKARNYATQAVANAGNLKLELVSDFDFPALKPTLPFGQLPYLEDGDVKFAQSNAILRYVAKKAGLDGSDDLAKFALSEMLIEESVDISNLLGKCHYAPHKAEAFNEFFAPEGTLAKHLAYLENLSPNKNTAGGIAIAATLDLCVALEATCLDNFPKMKAFHNELISSSAFDGIRDLPMYYSRD